MDMSIKKLDPDYIDGNTGEAVYKVPRSYGVTEFRTPQGVEVRQKEDRHRGSLYGGRDEHKVFEVKRELPNMFVSEDALVIPFEDMAAAILSRAEPAALAKALWDKLLCDEQWLDMDSAPTDGSHVIIQTETGMIAVAFVFTTRDKTASWWTNPEALHVDYKPVCWRPLPKPKTIAPALPDDGIPF